MADQLTKNKAGEFIWYELLAKDPQAASQFYAPILGWNIEKSEMPEMDYWLLRSEQSEIGGLMAVPDDTPMPSCWLGYIAVDNVDDALYRARSLGAAVHMQAMDIPNVGRIAMLADPQGACFYIMQTEGDTPSRAFADNCLGHCNWNELATTDPEAGLAFYQQMFGWQKGDAMDMGELGSYQFILQDGEMIGGMMAKMPEQPVSAWAYYMRVADIDAALDTAKTSGATLFMEPQEIPGGEYAVSAMDPQGAVFSLIGPRNQT